MDLKAIVLDIDGTLLNDQKEITPENKRIIIEGSRSRRESCVGVR